MSQKQWKQYVFFFTQALYVNNNNFLKMLFFVLF